MTTTKEGIGFDVSKDQLDYYFASGTMDQTPNSKTAIKKLLKQLNPASHYIVLEPTGTYSDKLAELAIHAGFEVRVVDPKKSHYYSRLVSKYNKTDQIAAKLLCQLSYQVELPLYEQKTEEMKARKQIEMALNALYKQSNQLKNQLHALDQYLYQNPSALNALRKALKAVQEQIKELESQLDNLADEESKEFTKYVGSVVGVGAKTARLLLLHTNGFKNFNSASKLVKYVGIAPASHQSGSSVKHRAKITKNGSSTLRATLYMAARAAKRWNLACKQLFERLRKQNKPYKVAMVAVMRKLLRQCFAVVKSKNLFDNGYCLKK